MNSKQIMHPCQRHSGQQPYCVCGFQKESIVDSGIGHGNIKTVGSPSGASIQDGSGWWAARSAIEQVRNVRKVKPPRYAPDFTMPQTPPSTKTNVAITNSCLLSRDQLLTSLSAKTRL